MSNWWVLLLLILGSYLIGCCNNAVMISKARKKDIRTVGSGNPGTLNMSRNFGIKLGLLTFFLDIMKGVIPTLVAFLLFRKQYFAGTKFVVSDLAIYLCGFFAVSGHIFPVFMKFKGGKGIATTIGVFLMGACSTGTAAWIVVVIVSLVGAGLFIYFTEFGAMGSFIAITPPAVAASLRLFIIYGMAFDNITFYIITNLFIFGICFITWFAHRKNIERMLAGEEHPTSIKQMIVKKKAKKYENTNN